MWLTHRAPVTDVPGGAAPTGCCRRSNGLGFKAEPRRFAPTFGRCRGATKTHQPLKDLGFWRLAPLVVDLSSMWVIGSVKSQIDGNQSPINGQPSVTVFPEWAKPSVIGLDGQGAGGFAPNGRRSGKG